MTEAELRTREIEKSIIKRFRKEIWRPFVRALNDYDMIKEGDKIAVGVSGGKDSLVLLVLLAALKKYFNKSFELEAVTIDMGLGMDYSGIEQDGKIRIKIGEDEWRQYMFAGNTMDEAYQTYCDNTYGG
mgnify:CR=1 FL=1